jgi:hypothetical protein
MERRTVTRRRRWALALVLAAALAAPAHAEVFAVSPAVRQLRSEQEEIHALRPVSGGAPLGEQRSRAVVRDDALVLDVVTHFASGEHWQERAEMDLRDGFRARSFGKQVRRGGELVAEQTIDFPAGRIGWLADGVRGTRTLELPPDVYVGPMLGVVLANVPESDRGAASFHAVVFSPDPKLYLLRADVMSAETFRAAGVSEPTTKVRLKADLGAVQNVLFANLIPTHYFWFTRESPPEFLAFEGTLGYGGPDLRMIPVRPAASTASLSHDDVTTR